MCCSCFLSAKSIQKCQSIPQDVFWMFHNLSKRCHWHVWCFSNTCWRNWELREKSFEMFARSCSIPVCLTIGQFESLKLETKFILFTCLTVMNSLTWIVCARIVITWLKRWKVVRRTHAWCKARGKPWKHVEVQPHLSPKTLFDPSLFQEKLIS